MTFTVEEPGIKAWEGTIASQIDNNPNSVTYGQYLKGGGTQIVIDFTHPENKAIGAKIKSGQRIPTGWGNTHLDINVPSKIYDFQILKAEEIEPKGNLTNATAGRFLPENESNKESGK